MLGLDEVSPARLPADKVARVRAERERAVTVMVGDGVIDDTAPPPPTWGRDGRPGLRQRVRRPPTSSRPPTDWTGSPTQSDRPAVATHRKYRAPVSGWPCLGGKWISAAFGLRAARARRTTAKKVSIWR